MKGAFEDLGFVVRAENGLLTTVYWGIKLPTGYEILSFRGGEQAVREMLEDCGLSQKTV